MPTCESHLPHTCQGGGRGEKFGLYPSKPIYLDILFSGISAFLKTACLR